MDAHLFPAISHQLDLRRSHDPHRLAHLQHEDLAAGAQRAGADDELHGLRDLLMKKRVQTLVGDGDGAAEVDLAAGDRQDELEEPSTLPKRTVIAKRAVGPAGSCAASTANSATALTLP